MNVLPQEGGAALLSLTAQEYADIYRVIHYLASTNGQDFSVEFVEGDDASYLYVTCRHCGQRHVFRRSSGWHPDVFVHHDGCIVPVAQSLRKQMPDPTGYKG